MKDFLTTTQTHPPQIPLPYYLLMLLAMVVLSYLSWRWYKNNIWRWTFLTIQAIQLFALYTWYLWQGFPLYISLPLYHCRMAMFAVLLLKDSKTTAIESGQSDGKIHEFYELYYAVVLCIYGIYTAGRSWSVLGDQCDRKMCTADGDQ